MLRCDPVFFTCPFSSLRPDWRWTSGHEDCSLSCLPPAPPVRLSASRYTSALLQPSVLWCWACRHMPLTPPSFPLAMIINMFHLVFWLILCGSEMGLQYFYTYWKVVFWTAEDLPSSSSQIFPRKTCWFVLKFSLSKSFWNSTHYFTAYLKFWLFHFFPIWGCTGKEWQGDTLSKILCVEKSLSPFSTPNKLS